MIQRVYDILASIIFEIVLFLSNNARYMEKHCKKKKFKYYERTIEHVLNKIYNEWIVIIYEYKITLGNEIKLNSISITISRTITEAKGDRAFWRENKFKLQIELFLHDDLEFSYNLQGKRIIDVYIYISDESKDTPGKKKRTFAKISCNARSTNRLPGHILLPAPKGATNNGEWGLVGVVHLSGKYFLASLKFSSFKPAIQVCKRTTVCKREGGGKIINSWLHDVGEDCDCYLLPRSSDNR